MTVCPYCNAIIGPEAAPDTDLELLTQKEAARLAKISQQKLQRLEAAGQGPARTSLGDRCVRYTRGAFIAWVRQRTTTPNT